jgi:ADP-heptose:LPS heptosyltransferase
LRRLDRLVGVPLLAVAGLVKRRRRLPSELRRIGVMKSTGIGDMVLATAVIRDLAAAFPAAEILVFAGPDNEAVARLLTGVRVVRAPMGKPWSAVRCLRAEGLDALVDLGQWTRVEAICALLSGAGYTIGFSTPGQHRAGGYDAVVPHSAAQHELENYRRIVSALGVTPEAEPRLTAPSEARRPPLPESRYVVFHLWPGGVKSERKEWSPDRWRALATLVVADGFSVVLTGAPADAEQTRAFVERCAGSAGRIHDVAGECAVDGLAAVLEGAACVVSVNTGVMHLAAALGVPTVALNGPTSARRWGPVGPHVASVDSELPGCGYLNLGFEYDGRRGDCMDGISVDHVVDAMLLVMRDD